MVNAVRPTASLVMEVNGKIYYPDLMDNSSTEAFFKKLEEGELVVELHDYGGFEKGAPLTETLPQNNEQMKTDAGDIILYQGKQFVIYYDKNSWSLTPLGKVTGMTKTEHRALLGEGNVTATLSFA